MAINKLEFTEVCVSQATHFGVHPHYLVAVAQLRSGITDDTEENRVGPFRFTQNEWDAHRVNTDFDLEFLPDQITSWQTQCSVFAMMTFRTQNNLLLRFGRYPSPIELYQEQWLDRLVEVPRILDALRFAFDSTAALIGSAADAISDESTGTWVMIADPDRPPSVPSTPSSCNERFSMSAPRVMSHLMTDFGFTESQAAGIVGNLGHHFGGFRAVQELSPFAVGVGGLGWAQWTGQRLKHFEAFCRNMGLQPNSDEANYAFLKQELQTFERKTVPALKATTTLNDAVRVFETRYVRARGIEFDSRRQRAERALSAFRREKGVSRSGLDLTEPQALETGEYLVWYGTNWRPIDLADIQQGYSGTQDTRVHYGCCQVFVPTSHKIGSLGSPWWQRLARRTDDRLKLVSTTENDESEFWKKVSLHLDRVDISDRHAVIFVHGYNVSFENAALRTAQIGYDLSIKGAMAFFSWPSQGEKIGYLADEATIEASEGAIANFMVDFATKSRAEAVHIIAHSMGNRGVLRAVNRIAAAAKQQSRIPFGQVILAAADVHADTFRQLCAAYSQVANRTTLYVSARDLAVEASRWLHKFPRVGLLPPVFVAQGLDTVNVTNVDLSSLGHGYVGEARDVLVDMRDLIMHDSPPEKRFGLRRDKTEHGERFWLIGK